MRETIQNSALNARQIIAQRNNMYTVTVEAIRVQRVQKYPFVPSKGTKIVYGLRVLTPETKSSQTGT